MLMSYEEFKRKLDEKIKTDDEFYYELLKTVVEYPYRYTGFFRLSNAKTKLIQNVTQSREIKFGDFMESIITDYIELIGYTNREKAIGCDENGDDLSADQVFDDGNTMFLVEQKIRDDHDSTKKRGQYENFQKKYSLLKRLNAYSAINATMWFIDDSLKKNKKFYLEEAKNETLSGVNINILYGRELFVKVFERPDVWDEICSYLERNKKERSEEVLSIPDFDTSDEIYEAILKLKRNEPNLYKKLMSDNPEYVQLRKELFPTGYNLRR